MNETRAQALALALLESLRTGQPLVGLDAIEKSTMDAVVSNLAHSLADVIVTTHHHKLLEAYQQQHAHVKMAHYRIGDRAYEIPDKEHSNE